MNRLRSKYESIAVSALVVLSTLSMSLYADGDDWSQWQGPDRNLISKEKGLLQAWPTDGPAIAWRVKGLGGGDSAPAVAGGKLYGMSIRDGKEVVWALRESDGKEVWVKPIGDAVQQRMRQSREGPACTPAVDGDRLYVIGMGGRVACLDVNDGKVIWARSFTDDFGGSLPMWSYRESPLVDGDKVICTPGGSDALIVALNKKTGETIWKGGNEDGGGGNNANRPGGGNAERQVEARGNTIAGTKDPDIFISEHWGMRGFSHKVSNGKYVAKLYFAETYRGITGKGQRVFTFDVQGKEFKDFDVWDKAGGANRAYIVTVPLAVTDETFRVTFTPQVENPAIKAIELLPQFDGAKETDTVRVNAGHGSDYKDSNGHVWKSTRGFEGGQVNANTLRVFGAGGGRVAGRGGRGGRAGAAYSSAIVIEVAGQRQYVQLTASAVVGVSAKDGKLLWRYTRSANSAGINCSTPVYYDGILFTASAYGAGGGAVKIVKEADGTFKAEEVYFTPRMQNHHGGMLVVDGALYGAHGGNGGGYLSCLDFKTGEVLWRDREGPKGAIAMADGRIYLRGESGTMLLIVPSREGLVVRGKFEQPDRSGSPAWSRPTIANGKMYIRDQDLLLCYDIKAKNL